jgi:hypothetical protein
MIVWACLYVLVGKWRCVGGSIARKSCKKSILLASSFGLFWLYKQLISFTKQAQISHSGHTSTRSIMFLAHFLFYHYFVTRCIICSYKTNIVLKHFRITMYLYTFYNVTKVARSLWYLLSFCAPCSLFVMSYWAKILYEDLCGRQGHNTFLFSKKVKEYSFIFV